MCKINAAVVWFYCFHFIPPEMDGVTRNPLAAWAKLHENKMSIILDTSGFYFTTK
ncbi:hypothetical protein ACQKM9_06490 [Viridibacillus sp. NPDC093762]|uniref:hypothetical protein n=1 Tax=Viridibacillus sp. NPDC093762 TaxID=3390720 RepID=UPI0004B8334B